MQVGKKGKRRMAKKADEAKDTGRKGEERTSERDRSKNKGRDRKKERVACKKKKKEVKRWWRGRKERHRDNSYKDWCEWAGRIWKERVAAIGTGQGKKRLSTGLARRTNTAPYKIVCG